MTEQTPVTTPGIKEIEFGNGSCAKLVRATATADSTQLLNDLQIAAPADAVIIVAGGGDPLDPAKEPRLQQMFNLGVVDLAAELFARWEQSDKKAAAPNVVILDAGVASGTAKLMGRAVDDQSFGIKLLGVAPAGYVSYPSDQGDKDWFEQAPALDDHHAAFRLVSGGILPEPGGLPPGDTQLLHAWQNASRAMLTLAAQLGKRTPAAEVKPETDQGAKDKPAKRTRPAPPEAPCVAVVLAAGDAVARHQALLAVRRGWPVIVIEGSGGIADTIASQKRADVVSTDDADVAEIVMQGNLYLVGLASPPPGLRRALLSCFSGPQLVEMAWRQVGMYDTEAKKHQRDFNRVENGILAVGVIVTFLVLLNSFLKAPRVQAPWLNGLFNWINVQMPGPYSFLASASFRAPLAGFLQTAVILLTVTLAVLIAWRGLFLSGRKWVMLRYGAEALKRAIYIYRTRPASFASYLVPLDVLQDGASGENQAGDGQGPGTRAARKGGAAAAGGAAHEAGPAQQTATDRTAPDKEGDAKDAQGSAPGDTDADQKQRVLLSQQQLARAYSREAELINSIERATQSVMKTVANQAALPRYEGDIPPQHAAADEDDGFTPLTPERYIELRIDNQTDFYHKRSKDKSRELRRWQVVALVASGVGTFLAAVGLDLWVALTTTIAAAAAGYLQYRLTEQTLTQYNQTSANLETVKGWWLALPPEAKADQARVRLLVDTSERIMATEQTGWTQSMESALDNLPKEIAPSVANPFNIGQISPFGASKNGRGKNPGQKS